MAGADALLDELHARGLFDGAVVIGREGRILYAGGRGLADRRSGLVFSPQTPVDGASLAKTFAAASIWTLIGEGRLDLDTRVCDVVPTFSNERVRVRHLLDHSAGLPAFDDPTGLTNADIAAAMPAASEFEPGSRFRYCNECFDLLALVVERVSGQEWGVFLGKRFFDPLGMEQTFLRPRFLESWPGQRALGYRREGGEVTEHDVFDDEPFYGSSNLAFSARDLSRWASFLIEVARDPEHPWRPGFERTVLGATRSRLNRLNWYVVSDTGPFHFSGHLRGFHHEVVWDPESGTSLVWVSNVLGGRPVPQRLTRVLWALTQEAEAEPPDALFDDWLGSARAPLDPSTVVGTYRLDGGGTVEIHYQADAWELILDGIPFPLYPHRPLYSPAHDVAIGFETHQEGRYRELLWETSFSPDRGRRVVPAGEPARASDPISVPGGG